MRLGSSEAAGRLSPGLPPSYAFRILQGVCPQGASIRHGPRSSDQCLTESESEERASAQPTDCAVLDLTQAETSWSARRQQSGSRNRTETCSEDGRNRKVIAKSGSPEAASPTSRNRWSRLLQNTKSRTHSTRKRRSKTSPSSWTATCRKTRRRGAWACWDKERTLVSPANHRHHMKNNLEILYSCRQNNCCWKKRNTGNRWQRRQRRGRSSRCGIMSAGRSWERIHENSEGSCGSRWMKDFTSQVAPRRRSGRCTSWSNATCCRRSTTRLSPFWSLSAQS